MLSMVAPSPSFTERDFYLSEFRGRAIGISLPIPHHRSLARLGPVLEALARNGTRVVLFGSSGTPFPAEWGPTTTLSTDPVWTGPLWRSLVERGWAAVTLPEVDFATHCASASIQLGLAKVVWITDQKALLDASGARISVVALDSADAKARDFLANVPDWIPVAEIREMLVAGVASVNVCRLQDLEDELFTYAGAGTFFSLERYTVVRPLVLENFDLAASLLEHGVAEGYLAARSPSQIERLLAHGFGVFVEGRFLAGFCALLPDVDSGLAEIAGLYTVTRFAGEGVGGQLVRYAVEQAGRAGWRRVFACTTSERVEGFFLRNGFERLDPEQIPPSKWDHYPAERRARLRCLGMQTQAKD